MTDKLQIKPLDYLDTYTNELYKAVINCLKGATTAKAQEVIALVNRDIEKYSLVSVQ